MLLNLSVMKMGFGKGSKRHYSPVQVCEYECWSGARDGDGRWKIRLKLKNHFSFTAGSVLAPSHGDQSTY